MGEPARAPPQSQKKGGTALNRINFFVEGSLRKYRERFESVCPAPMTVPKGQDLLRQCVTQGWLYYILDGLAKVYVATTTAASRSWNSCGRTPSSAWTASTARTSRW